MNQGISRQTGRQMERHHQTWVWLATICKLRQRERCIKKLSKVLLLLKPIAPENEPFGNRNVKQNAVEPDNAFKANLLKV